MHPCWRVCGKNLNIVSMCAVSPVVHTSNISRCQKKLSIFLWLWTIPLRQVFGFLVIKVGNHGEHYETPCIKELKMCRRIVRLVLWKNEYYGIANQYKIPHYEEKLFFFGGGGPHQITKLGCVQHRGVVAFNRIFMPLLNLQIQCAIQFVYVFFPFSHFNL